MAKILLQKLWLEKLNWDQKRYVKNGIRSDFASVNQIKQIYKYMDSVIFRHELTQQQYT